jgi:hypothetical protein
MGFEKDATKATWYIKKHETPHLQLSDELKVLNEKIEIFRRYIEHTFGDIKARFRVVFEPFRHDRTYLDPIWHFCCAIHNLIVDYFHNEDSFEAHWKGPIPQLEPPIKKRVLVLTTFFLNSR